MSDSSSAVFLSYASQDAEAARRIAEALRAADVEVWFDLNELRGGDAWDQKIRRQIKECALFVPVISANTQARAEGYFRLEWKLAVDRSHLMADDQPFLVPVVIDATSEAAARVPDRFRDVQWTRLVRTETPSAFAERMRTLLGGGPVAGARPDAQRREDKKTAGASVWWTRVIPLAGIAFGLVFATRPWWAERPSREHGGPPRPAEKNAAAPAPHPEARQLMARAKALYEPWEGATREDFALAEQLLKQATALEAADAEIWAAAGLVACGQISLRHDSSPARVEAARGAAERAVRLAPESKQARFAQAFYFRNQFATLAESDRMLKELAEQPPDDALILRTYAVVLRGQKKYDEALALLERAAALPGGGPSASYSRYLVLTAAERYPEAEAALDAAIARVPAPYLLRAKAQCLTLFHGDVAGAAALIERVPPTHLLEDTGAHWASQLRLWQREPARALGVWRGVPRDLIETAEFRGPKAFLVGEAHRIAGQPEAAQAQWAAALRVVEPQHAAQPSAAHWVYWKARLLALLGRAGEAEPVLKTFEQLRGARGLTDDTIPIYLALGRNAEVLDVLEKGFSTMAARANATQLTAYRHNLRLNPEWDSLRREARFVALLETVEAARPARP